MALQDKAQQTPPGLKASVAPLVAVVLLLIGARFIRLGVKAYTVFPVGDVVAVLEMWARYWVGFVLIGAALVPQLTPHIASVLVRIRLTSLLEVLQPVIAWSARHQIKRWVFRGLPVFVSIWVIGTCAVAAHHRWSDYEYTGSDGILFSQYAVELLLNGENPYSHSMSPIRERSGHEARVLVTHRIDGSTVDALSYPALSFLLFVPQALLSGNTSAFDLTSVFVLCLVLLYLVWRSPPFLCWVPLVLTWIDPDLVNFSKGGVFDILWLPFLLWAMDSWRTRRIFLSGVFFGLAACVKQTPWLVGPFLIMWLLTESRPWPKKFSHSFALGTGFLVAFIVPNLYFIVDDPNAWTQGVLTPIWGQHAPLVQQGVGAVFLSSSGLLTLPKSFWALVFGGAITLLLLIYFSFFKNLRWLAWVIPMFALWFNYRSLQSYFSFFSPVAYYVLLHAHELAPRYHKVLSFDGLQEPSRGPLRGFFTPWRVVTAATAALVVLLFTNFEAHHAKTKLSADAQLISAADPSGLGHASELQLHLKNREDSPLRPVFSGIHGAHQTRFYWNTLWGPKVLAPGQSATYRIQAPCPQATIPVHEPAMFAVNDAGKETQQAIAHGRLPPIFLPFAPSGIPNPRFEFWTRHDGNRQATPYLWRLSSDRHTEKARWSLKRVPNGLYLSITAEAPRRRGPWRHIGVSRSTVFPEVIHIDATPSRLIPAGYGRPGNPAGLELSSERHRIWILFSSEPEILVRFAELGRLSYAFIYVPAKANERKAVTIDLHKVLGQHYAERFRREKNGLLLFVAVYPNSYERESAITFHEVSQPKGPRDVNGAQVSQ